MSEFVTETTGCTHFHPFTCGKQVVAPCPVNCRRKEAFTEYFDQVDELVEDCGRRSPGGITE